MLSIITKKDYFAALDAGCGDPTAHTLKGIQDAWVEHYIQKPTGLTVLEVGGGYSRVLPKLAEAGNTCINLDKCEGADGGPTEPAVQDNIKLVQAFLGDNDPSVADGSVDIVCSVSTVEHIKGEALVAAMQEHARILKPGGIGVHAIDVIVGDKAQPIAERRMADLRSSIAQAGLRLVGPDTIKAPLLHRPCYASQPAIQLYSSWRQPPALGLLVLTHEAASIKLVLTKDA